MASPQGRSARAEPDATGYRPTRVSHGIRRWIYDRVWRQTLATAVKWRNPLFCEELGISPHRSMTGDWLHALSQGTFQVWIMHVWHMIIARDVWRHGGTQEFKLAAGAKRILAELSAYYNGLPTAQRDRVSQLRELSAKMIGTREDPSFKLKGGQANGVLPFHRSLAHTLPSGVRG